MLSYTAHSILTINVVNLTYSSIPAWTELGPAQSQLVPIFKGLGAKLRLVGKNRVHRRVGKKIGYLQIYTPVHLILFTCDR